MGQKVWHQQSYICLHGWRKVRYSNIWVDCWQTKGFNQRQLLANWMRLDYFMQLQKSAYIQTKARKCNSTSAWLQRIDSKPHEPCFACEWIGKGVYKTASSSFIHVDSLQQRRSLCAEVLAGGPGILHHRRCWLLRWWWLSECYDETRRYHQHSWPSSLHSSNGRRVAETSQSLWSRRCGQNRWPQRLNPRGARCPEEWVISWRHPEGTCCAHSKANWPRCIFPACNRCWKAAQDQEWQDLEKCSKEDRRGPRIQIPFHNRGSRCIAPDPENYQRVWKRNGRREETDLQNWCGPPEHRCSDRNPRKWGYPRYCD